MSHLEHRTQTMGTKEGLTWTAYLKIILPLANILYEMREDEKHSCWMEIATQSLCFIQQTTTTKNPQKHTQSAIWWQQKVFLVEPKTSQLDLLLSFREHKPSGKENDHRQSFTLLRSLQGTEILPQHRIQTSGCPSCGDTWASEQARWAGTHPDRGHLSWFLYPPCMRTPGKK